ncbi:hypothetical protein TrCOL_g5849 [Triparma columacea]|uniref:Uncharacterized protein n=1 Tax=Triparma columacea TaxID=722753 RepID=A0A9W7GNM1_9STRA|nr:hypothetical protein TrCOL_g5849 [Triparma columacea]
MSSGSGSEKPTKKPRTADSTPTSPRTQHTEPAANLPSSSLPATLPPPASIPPATNPTNSSDSVDDDDVADEAANYPDYEDDDGIADEEALKDINIDPEDKQQLFEAFKARATMFKEIMSPSAAKNLLLQHSSESPVSKAAELDALDAMLEKEGIEGVYFRWPFSSAAFGTFLPVRDNIRLRSSLGETRNMHPNTKLSEDHVELFNIAYTILLQHKFKKCAKPFLQDAFVYYIVHKGEETGLGEGEEEDIESFEETLVNAAPGEHKGEALSTMQTDKDLNLANALAFLKTYPTDIDFERLSRPNGPVVMYRLGKKVPTNINPFNQEPNPFAQRFSQFSHAKAFQSRVQGDNPQRDESNDVYANRMRGAVDKAYKELKVEVPKEGIPNSAWNASSFGPSISCLSQTMCLVVMYYFILKGSKQEDLDKIMTYLYACEGSPSNSHQASSVYVATAEWDNLEPYDAKQLKGFIDTFFGLTLGAARRAPEWGLRWVRPWFKRHMMQKSTEDEGNDDMDNNDPSYLMLEKEILRIKTVGSSTFKGKMSVTNMKGVEITNICRPSAAQAKEFIEEPSKMDLSSAPAALPPTAPAPAAAAPAAAPLPPPTAPVIQTAAAAPAAQNPPILSAGSSSDNNYLPIRRVNDFSLVKESIMTHLISFGLRAGAIRVLNPKKRNVGFLTRAKLLTDATLDCPTMRNLWFVFPLFLNGVPSHDWTKRAVVTEMLLRILKGPGASSKVAWIANKEDRIKNTFYNVATGGAAFVILLLKIEFNLFTNEEKEIKKGVKDLFRVAMDEDDKIHDCLVSVGWSATKEAAARLVAFGLFQNIDSLDRSEDVNSFANLDSITNAVKDDDITLAQAALLRTSPYSGCRLRECGDKGIEIIYEEARKFNKDDRTNGVNKLKEDIEEKFEEIKPFVKPIQTSLQESFREDDQFKSYHEYFPQTDDEVEEMRGDDVENEGMDEMMRGGDEGGGVEDEMMRGGDEGGGV